VTGLLLPSDHDRIADRVRDGDPIVGWRGDATMDTYLNERTGDVEVWAFDAKGERYCAASVSASAPGWKHTLLTKLRDGDPQRGAWEKWMADQEKAHAEKEKANWNQLEERADRLAWGLRRVYGHDVDGLSKEFY
jgi:hypothetical protein